MSTKNDITWIDTGEWTRGSKTIEHVTQRMKTLGNEGSSRRETPHVLLLTHTGIS